MNPIRSFWKFGAVAILATVLVAACGGADQRSSVQADQMAPPEQQILRLRLSGEPKGIDPHRASFGVESSVVKQLFSALFRYDESLNVITDLAAEIPAAENGGISKDGKTYTIKLRKDLKWSDGQALTANDIVYSFKRMLDPKLASPYASSFSAMAGAKDYATALGTKAAPKDPSDADLATLRDGVGVSAKDEQTLVFTLTSPSVSFLQQLALPAAAPVRKDVVEKYGESWTEAGNLVGNGPFVLKEWAHGSHFTFEPNPNWHLGKAKLSKLTFRIIEDEIAAYAAYLAGEIDVGPVPAANRREVMTAGTALSDQLLRKTDLATFAFMFNNKEKPWDNAKVRQAFATAFDRKTFIEAILQGVGRPTTSWLPPGMPGYDAAAGRQYEFDAAKAKQLLSDAGYPNADGLPKVTLILRTSDMNRVVSQFLQDQFKKNLGVEIDIELVDAATFQARFTRGQFNLTLNAWSADSPYPDSWLPELFGSGGSLNSFGYSNAKVDDLLQRAAAETDTKKQVDLYAQAQKLILDEAGIGPIYNRETFVLVKPRVRDLKVTSLDGAIRGDWNLWKTWIANS